MSEDIKHFEVLNRQLSPPPRHGDHEHREQPEQRDIIH